MTTKKCVACGRLQLSRSKRDPYFCNACIAIGGHTLFAPSTCAQCAHLDYCNAVVMDGDPLPCQTEVVPPPTGGGSLWWSDDLIGVLREYHEQRLV